MKKRLLIPHQNISHKRKKYVIHNESKNYALNNKLILLNNDKIIPILYAISCTMLSYITRKH